MMPGMPERRTNDYVRNGVTSLFAAFDIATGKVISSLHRRHRSVEFRKFLAKIDKTVPAELDVHVICDNYATHKTEIIQKWLAKHPRFHIHFIPTSSSWNHPRGSGMADSIPLVDRQARGRGRGTSKFVILV